MLDSFSSLEYMIVVKVIYAGLMGAVVGLERQIKGKPAGLKTNALISMGAALYTTIAIFVGNGLHSQQLGRVIAQIVTGVGFIGAGTIMRMSSNKEEGEFTIGGLTSAAVTWMVAAIGISVGVGLFLEALVLSVSTFFLLLFMSGAEKKAPRIKKKVLSRKR
jgi:putative Mg2+ transporter-C (MgtC) family protein